MVCTNAWYSPYQPLVFTVPTFGIRCTNAWYLSYQRLVFVVPGINTKLVSLSN